VGVPETGRLTDVNCLLLEALRRERPTEEARTKRHVLCDLENALEKGADPNHEHWERTTPPSQAILANRLKAVRRLLEAGARPLDWMWRCTMTYPAVAVWKLRGNIVALFKDLG